MGTLSDGQCLVVRPAPNLIQDDSCDLVEQLSELNLKSRSHKATVETPIKPQIQKEHAKMTVGSHKKEPINKAVSAPINPRNRQSPASFLQMQSVRSSALARKTNTVTKFGGSTGADLMDTLLKKSSIGCAAPVVVKKEVIGEKENETVVQEVRKKSIGEKTIEEFCTSLDSGKGDELKDDEVELADGELMGRMPGPIRGARVTCKAAPYYTQQQLQQQQLQLQSYRQSCEQKRDPQNYETANDHYWTSPYAHSPQTERPCSYQSASYYPENRQPGPNASPFADQLMTNADLNRLLETPKELPDSLSDFILKYSRRYTNSGVIDTKDFVEFRDQRKSSDAGSDTSESTVDTYSVCPSERPCSADGVSDSGIDSPLSVNSAPRVSPAAPKGGQTPTTPTKQNQSLSNNRNRYKPILPKTNSNGHMTTGRERMRSLLTDRDMDEAWAWTCKCTQSCPGALYYCDPDGDTLLHIVVWHKDYAKVYALVEQMVKIDESNQPAMVARKPYDAPNRLYETPLFLAVEKRSVEMVSYLLDVGANPNFATRRPDRDAPLHYAASRGMTDMVETLLTQTNTIQLDTRNGMGLTPLLCAVRNHGVIEEESQCLINNKPTIRALLKAGANAHLADMTNGKTVLHYAVERMDPDLVEIFTANLSPDAMGKLCRLCDANEDNPVQLLERLSDENDKGVGLGRFEAEEELRKKMFFTLISAGAQTQAPATQY